METDDIIANIFDAGGQVDDNDNSGINISDVIEVIQTTDPTASIMFPSVTGIDGACGGGGDTNNIGNMEQYNGNQNISQMQQYQQLKQNDLKKMKKEAYVRIIEQPASKALRFRYECEGRSAGSIPGVKSTPENKTFPTIEIVGYKGPAVVVVSCVTKDQPYRPHPHNLVGKESCKRGVCTVEIKSETMRAVFSNLGIQCVKKKDIENALRVREEIRVDPFKTGFSHRFQPSSLDLNSVRLCFQVFVENEKKGRFQFPLPPVVSDPIYDKKAMSDLVICTLCSCSSTVAGGKEIILLCEKVAKEDISVRFFEEHDGQTVWEGYGDFQHTDVHKQTAIKFRTPSYRTLEINQPVKVFIQLKRPSDGATSEPLQFDYLPLDSGRRTFWSLRTNIKGKPDLELFRQILSEDSELNRTPTENCNPISTVIEENTPSPSIKSNDIINLDTPVTDEEKPIVNDEDYAKRKSECEVDNIVNEIVKEMEIEQQNDSSPISNPPDDVSAVTTIVTSPLNAQISNDKTTEWIKSSEFERNDSIQSTGQIGPNLLNPDEDKTLNDLLDQVAELDEIYTDHVLRRDTFQNTIANELAGLDNCLPKTDTVEQMDLDEMFDDAATYTSLQKAFKNPISIQMPPTPPASHIASDDTQHYDPVDIIVNPPGPIISTSMAAAAASLKREIMSRQEEEKLPPLPPKRVKKQDNIENRPIDHSPTDRKCQSANSSPSARPHSQIIIMKTPDQSPPTKKLPPTPTNTNTLPKQKKPGFFSKLFSRRKSKTDINSTNSSTDNIAPIIVASGNSPIKASPEISREPSINHFNITDPNRSSLRSLKSLQPNSVSTSPTKDGGKTKTGKPVGRSVSSVSGKRPYLSPDVIHIPLKGDSYNSLPMNEQYSNASTITLNNNLDRKTVSALQLANLPLQDGNMELIAIADAQSLKNLCEGQYGVELDPNVDLTEAEHFALYTSIPPQATANPAVLKRKRQKINGDPMVRLPEYYQQQNRMDYQLDQNPQIHNGRTSQQLMNPFLNIDQSTIKVEPRDSSPSPFMFASTSYRIPDQSPSPQPISPQNLYINTPSPYSLGGANSNITNQLISPNNNNNNNFSTTAGNISPNLTITGLPDYNPYHQQQPQYAGLNYNTWNNDNNNNGANGGGQLSGYNKKQNSTNNNLNFNITNNNNNGSNNNNNNNNHNNNNNNNNNNHNTNDVQQWNLSAVLKQSINNFHMLNNTQNVNNQNNILQTQSHSNSINLGNVNTGDAPNLSSLLDMDSEQLIHLNSAELRGLSLS